MESQHLIHQMLVVCAAEVNTLYYVLGMAEGYPVFVILTKDPTTELAKIHDRMPLMLPKEKINEWINPSSNPVDLIQFALSDMITEKV